MFQSEDFDDILSDDTFAVLAECDSQTHKSEPEPSAKTLYQNSINIISKLDEIKTDFPGNLLVPEKTETPSKTKRKRKFPGPAGLLPDKFIVNSHDKNTNVPLSQSFPNSQNVVSSTVFEEAPWMLMLSEMRGIENHTILNIKQKALEHRLVGRKVPILTGVVQSIDRTLPDPLLVLRDRTAEIQCTLHRDAWEHLSCHLVPHYSVVVLKNSTIFSTRTALKKIYLNITNNNVLAVYCDEENIYSANGNILKSSKVELYKTYSENAIVMGDSRVIVLRNAHVDKGGSLISDNNISNLIEKSTLEDLTNNMIAETLLDGITDEFISQDFQ